jgi:hypothetical protein
MTKREIASLTIKMMGVYCLIKAIANVPMTIGVIYSQTMMQSSITEAIGPISISILVLVVFFAASFLIIAFSDKIAKRLIRESANTSLEINTSMKAEQVMAIAVSCIGLYFLVAAFPSLIRQTMMYFMRRSHSAYAESQSLLFQYYLGPLVQLILGAWLFMGSKGIVKLWKKIRS